MNCPRCGTEMLSYRDDRFGDCFACPSGEDCQLDATKADVEREHEEKARVDSLREQIKTKKKKGKR